MRKMKTIQHIFLTAVIAFWAIANPIHAETEGDGIEVGPAPVVEVTIYLSGAEVVREVTARVPRGASTVTVLHFPDSIEPAQVRVSSGIASAQVSSMTVGAQTLGVAGDVEELDQQLAELEDQIFELDQIDQDQAAMRSFLVDAVATKTRAGTEADPAEELDRDSIQWIYGLMGSRFSELLTERIARRKTRRAIVAQVAELKATRADATRTETIRVAHVQVQAERAGMVPIRFRYFVSEAQWAPRYRASLGEDGVVELIAEAAVRQWTQDDWPSTRLRLTTVTPSKRLGPPRLGTWTVKPWQPPASTINQLDLSKVPAARDPWAIVTQTPGVLTDRLNAGGKETMQQAFFIAPGTADGGGTPASSRKEPKRLETVSTRYTVTFDAVGRPSVPGDGQTKRVELWRERLPATVSYRVKPSLLKDAFLEAAIRVPDKLPLLAGSILIYAGDSRLGEARVPEVPPGANLILPFGVDKRVQVERKVVDVSSERKGSKRQIITHAYRTTLTNLTGKPISVALEDRQPISEDESIVVTVVDERTTPGAIASKTRSGVWIWQLDLQSAEPREVDFAFTVQHPSEMRLQGFE